jgi:ABC-type uncharacterized transport system
MRPLFFNRAGDGHGIPSCATPRAASGKAHLRVVFALAAVFLLGIGAYALLFEVIGVKPGLTRSEASQPAVTLAESTIAVLKRLNSPVQFRFYAILDPAAATEALSALASRASRLLAEYQRQSGGHITLTEYSSRTDAALAAADADGIPAFSLDKGDGCYLGLAMAGAGRKESLPRLSPDWEQALEPDITRALIQLITPPRTNAAAAVSPSPAAIEDVKRLIPNIASVSQKQGKEILRKAALDQFTAVVKESNAKINEAERKLTEAQAGQSKAAVQAALKELQQARAEQNERLQEVAAKSQANIRALEQIKASSQ